MNDSIDFPRRTFLALALLGAAAGAFAFSLTLNTEQPPPNGTGLPIKWPAGTVPLRLMLAGTATLIDGSTYNQSVTTAANNWNINIGSVQFVPEVATGEPTDFNLVNELAFAATLFGREFEEGTLAVTSDYRYGNQRYESDVIFNTAYTWNSYRGDLRVNGTVVTPDIQRVALHELGHVLGLDHPDEAGQTVDALMNSAISNRYQLSSDDLQGAHALYGSSAVPANDNFANSVLLVGGGNGAVLSTSSGNNAKATKEPGEPSHANDEGDETNANPGGRSVWWRWTAPSSGRLTIDTRGSYFDTLLGVHTGNAVGALTRVAGDDDIDSGVVQASRVTFDAVVSTTYHIAVDGFNNDDGTGADSGGITLSLTFDGDPGAPPAITTQPASLSRTVGESAVFSVTATGTAPLTYQWHFNNSPIDGATASSHTHASVATTHAGNYHCVVSNPSGSTTSATATLTVNTLPQITTQPVGVTVTAGGRASFSVTATGTAPLSYQWLFNNAAIAGATAATHEIASTTTAHGGNYSVTVTNVAGSVTSTAVTLTVNSPPPPPAPSGGGGGGGGGAPSPWFVAVLALLTAIRRLRRNAAV